MKITLTLEDTPDFDNVDLKIDSDDEGFVRRLLTGTLQATDDTPATRLFGEFVPTITNILGPRLAANDG